MGYPWDFRWDLPTWCFFPLRSSQSARLRWADAQAAQATCFFPPLLYTGHGHALWRLNLQRGFFRGGCQGCHPVSRGGMLSLLALNWGCQTVRRLFGVAPINRGFFHGSKTPNSVIPGVAGQRSSHDALVVRNLNYQ